MAIFHRSKEKWNPKKSLVKGSKNRTYELKRKNQGSSTNVFDLQNAFLMRFGIDDQIEWISASDGNASDAVGRHLFQYDDVQYTKLPSSWNPQKLPVSPSQFSNAIDFSHFTGANRNTQGDHNYFRNTANHVQYTQAQLFGGPQAGTDSASQTGSRNIFISFWIKLHSQNAHNDGHTFAHWGLGGDSTFTQPYSIDPFMSFFVDGSGSVQIRFAERHEATDDLAGTPNAGDDYMYVDGGLSFLQVASEANRISVGNWHHVTFGLKFSNGFNAAEATANTQIWIDGNKVSTPAITSVAPSDFNFSGSPSLNTDFSTTTHEWQFGSLVNGYGSYNFANPNHVLKRSSGFSGALGEFLVITQDCANDDARNTFGKFIYEASREGVYGIHSGAHNPTHIAGGYNHYQLQNGRSINFERFAKSYPPNKGGFDQSTLTTVSGSIFKEGICDVDTFDKNPSMYWKQPLTGSNSASPNITKDTVVLPQFGTAVGDPILPTWLSEARSKIFEEDLDSTHGFVVSPEPKKEGYGFDAELYPSRVTKQTIGPFNDITTKKSNEVGEYEKAFTIDIPISHGNTACTMTTDSGTERALIKGTADQINYELNFYGGHVVYIPAGYNANDIGTQTTKTEVSTGLNSTFKGHTSGGYGAGWLPCIIPDGSGGSHSATRADMFGFSSGAAGSTALSLILDTAELDSWLRLLTVLKHTLHRQLQVPINTALTTDNHSGGGDYFWLERVYGGNDQGGAYTPGSNGANIVAEYRNNPLWTNIVWTILNIPAPTWTITGSSPGLPTNAAQPQLQITKYTQLMISMAIYLLKNYGGNGYSLTNPVSQIVPGGKLNSENQPPPSQYWQVGGPYALTANINSNYQNFPTYRYLGFFYPVKSPTDTDLSVYRSAYSPFFWSPAKEAVYLSSGGYDYYPLVNKTLGSPAMAAQDPLIKMKTMAYHNFQTGNWETLSGGKGSTDGFGTVNGVVPDPLHMMDDGTIGFSPMTSLMYPYTVDKLEEVIDSAGRPTDSFGFPFHDKYKSGPNQSFDLSEYLSEPVILKGWELRMKVIPKVTSAVSSISYNDNTYSPEGYEIDVGNFVYGGSLPSPIVWYENSNKMYATSYPTETASVARTSTNADAQITKGVTAFLLKESSTQESSKLLDMYYRNDHQFSFYSNCVNTGSLPVKEKSDEIISEGAVELGTNITVGNATTFTGGPTSSSFFSSNTSRELLGYLQHVYHNDAKFNESDLYEVRTQQATQGDLSTVQSVNVNFGSLFDRENTTYISNIDSNTTQYDMHVSGSMKLNSKITNQSIISPFYVRTGNFNPTPSNVDPIHFGMNLGQDALDSRQPFSTNYTIFNSWDGGLGTGELVDGMTTNSVSGQTLADTISIPKFCVPVSDTSGTYTPKINPLTRQSSINPSADTDVILYPTDKLILGIQDSISTFIGSQIIDWAGNPLKFGRQSLQIPSSQKNAYIRLYLERRRMNKPIVVRSNQSHGFSADVNEDLGDTMVLDQYELAPTRVYSGSISDDIMAPEPAEPSRSELRVSFNQFRGDKNGNAFSGASQVIPDITTHATLSGTHYPFSPLGTHNAQYPDITYNWIFCNELTFKDRSPDGYPAGNFFDKKPSFLTTPIGIGQSEIYNGTSTTENSGGADNKDNLEQLCSTAVSMWPVVGNHAAGGTTKINPWPAFTGQDTKLRLGGCSALWELNRNKDRVAPTASDNDKQTVASDGSFDWNYDDPTHSTPYTTDVPSFSSWKFRAVLPLFSTAHANINFNYIRFTVRLIAIDVDCKPQAYNPTGSGSWENLDPGDMFFFSKTAHDTTRGSHAIKIATWNGKNSASQRVHTHTGVNWSEHLYGAAPVYYADVYVVAAMGKVYPALPGGTPLFHSFSSHGTDAVGCWSPHPATGGEKLQWDSMMAGIKKVLEVEPTNVTGLNYTITSENPDEDWFQIRYLQDDYVNDALLGRAGASSTQTLQENFNTLTQFSLMGTTGVEEDVPDSRIYSYRANHDGGYSNAHITDFGQTQYKYQSGASPTLIANTNPSAHAGTVTGDLPGMTPSYFRVHPTRGTDAVGGGNYNLRFTDDGINVDYSYLPQKDGVKMNVVPKKFTPEISPETKIDRKIAYRTTEGSAGPFGSLNKFQVLFQDSGHNVFHDSKRRGIQSLHEPVLGVSDANVKVTDYVTDEIAQVGSKNECFTNVSKEIPPGWLMLHYRDKISAGSKAISVRIESPVNTNVATPTLPNMAGNPGKTKRDDAIYVNKDVSGNTVVYASNLANSEKEYIEVVDHILETFPIGKKDKIFGDVLGGFGDGPQGRLVYRPSKYKHEAFNTGATTGLPTHFLVRLDPVRGSRFGLYSTQEQRKRYVFDNRSYGQFSNMFEQSLDSRFHTDPDDTIDGAPVRMSSRNLTNPSQELPLDQNPRRNTDQYQRCSYPFFDKTGITLVDYGATLPTDVDSLYGPDLSGLTFEPDSGQTFNSSGDIDSSSLPNNNLRVNVVGSLKSTKVVTPGQQGNTLKKS